MADLQGAVDAAAAFIAQHPEHARVTEAADCELVDGTTVAVRIGHHLVAVDQAHRLGGGGTAPSPGDYALVAVGACIAISYRIWSQKLDVPIDTLWVEVRGDIDARGGLGVTDAVRPGFDDVRVIVHVTGSGPSSRYAELRRIADAHSPMLDVLRSPVPTTTRLVHDG